MSNVGELSVNINADTSGFDRGVQRAQGSTGNLRRRMAAVAKSAARLGTAMAAAGAAITAALVRRGLNAVDEQAKLARQLDSTQASLVGYQRAAEDSGVSASVATRAAERLGQRLGEALRDPTSRSAEALDRLGLSAQELQRLDVDERMAALADAMNEGGLSADQMSDELRQLGIRQGEMVRLMQDGGDAIRDATKEMESYGVAMSDVDAAQIEAANDAMSRIGEVIQGISNRLAVQFAPILEGIANLFTETASESDIMGDIVERVFNGVITVVSYAADVVGIVRRAFRLIIPTVQAVGISIESAMFKAAAAILEGPVNSINVMIRTMNKLPGIDFGEVEQPEFVNRFRDRADEWEQAAQDSRNRVAEIISEPLPGAQMREWVSEQQDLSRESAESVVADRENERDRTREIREAMNREISDMDEDAYEEERNRRAENLENIRAFLRSEREAEEHAHEERMQFLREAHEDELITDEQFREKKEALEREHQDRLTAIFGQGEEERSELAKANRAIRENAMRQEAATLRSGLQTMFGDHKAFGEALGHLKRVEAVMSAYAWGSSIGGPPAGAAAAATAAAAQVASLRDMQSASMSGGGSVGGTSQAAAGSGTAPVSADGSGAEQPIVANVNIQGGSGAAIRRLIEDINVELDGGMRLRA